VLAGQMSTSAKQTACTPTAAVVVAASSVQHHEVTAQQLCAQLQSVVSSAQLQGGASGVKSSGNVVYDSFVHSYVGNVLSTSFDRTFPFISIITVIGVIPALFLRKPEKTRGQVPIAA